MLISRFIDQKQVFTTFIVFLICISLLISCHSYEKYEGVKFIASRGDPPAQYLVWSPSDLNQVLITSNSLNIEENIVSIQNLKSKEKRIIKKTERGTLYGVAWMPESEEIIVTMGSGEFGGTSKTLLINDVEETEKLIVEGALLPALSPNGEILAYFSSNGQINPDLREHELHLRNIKSQEDVIVLEIKIENIFGLSWAPDGNKLVYSAGFIKSKNIYVFDIESGKTIQITDEGNNSNPNWSPKGDLIVYDEFSNRGLITHLSIIRSDGSCEFEFLHIKDLVSAPTWLPDGKTIGFIGEDGIYGLDLNEIFVDDIYQEECPQAK